MEYQFIQTPEGLVRWCEEIRSCRTIALDTEFLGESRYRPELCLVQVEAEGRLALLDPLSVHLHPFWEVLVAHDKEVIVHGGSQDILFCYQAVGKMPSRLVDVQIAAGLIGLEYPAGFSTLMERLLGRCFSKAETRTDWRRRPLSAQQIEYALEDVRYLRELWGVLQARLDQWGRQEWFWEEIRHWKEELIRKAQEEGWRRLPGCSGLSPRGLAIVRELWHWRERQAERRNCPARFVLRDDLLVELARRQTANIHRIGAVRGLDHAGLRRHLPQIAACIDRALHLPEDQLPKPTVGTNVHISSVLNQFLYAALATRCRQAAVAPNLVASLNQIREWLGYRLGIAHPAEPPLLSTGWRAQLLGNLLEECLAGRLALRIHDPQAELPLEMIPSAEVPPVDSSPPQIVADSLPPSAPPESAWPPESSLPPPSCPSQRENSEPLPEESES